MAKPKPGFSIAAVANCTASQPRSRHARTSAAWPNPPTPIKRTSRPNCLINPSNKANCSRAVSRIASPAMPRHCPSKSNPPFGSRTFARHAVDHHQRIGKWRDCLQQCVSCFPIVDVPDFQQQGRVRDRPSQLGRHDPRVGWIEKKLAISTADIRATEVSFNPVRAASRPPKWRIAHSRRRDRQSTNHPLPWQQRRH